MNKSMKTLKGWKESLEESIRDYLEIGDEVDQELVDYFVNVLPPATLRGDLVQMGEPYSHEPDENGKYRATYLTFARERYSGNWKYAGICFRGEKIAVEKKYIKKEKIISGLESLIDDAKSHIAPDETDTIFHHDVKVLKAAIRIITTANFETVII